MKSVIKRTMKTTLSGLVLLLLTYPVLAFDAKPTELTLADILTAPTLDRSCHHYCLTGICVWLKCTLVSCRIKTSVRVRHYNPDLVVSVYDQPGDNPWREAQSLFGATEKRLSDSLVSLFHSAPAGGGHRVEGGSPAADQSLRFKEATAIGNPQVLASDFLASTGYFCPSAATPFMPYFSSSIDALSWRLGTPEMLYLSHLLPGRRVVGSGLQQQWGPVWPRTGFILQKDDAKAAAVIAQRVGNIVTQAGQPHIYSALDDNGYSKTWLPGELIENREETGVWQMLAPKVDQQCYVFGKNDVLSRAWSAGRQTADKRYAFSLWRPYECCQKKGAYLFTVPLRLCL